MAVYLVLTYDVTDADRYAEYNPGSIPAIMETVTKHGGAPAFAGHPEFLTGTEAATSVGITVPDADAAKAWLDDPDYAPLKAIRLESTANINSYIIPAFG